MNLLRLDIEYQSTYINLIFLMCQRILEFFLGFLEDLDLLIQVFVLCFPCLEVTLQLYRQSGKKKKKKKECETHTWKMGELTATKITLPSTVNLQSSSVLSICYFLSQRPTPLLSRHPLGALIHPSEPGPEKHAIVIIK